jgi:hypothetical protein
MPPEYKYVASFLLRPAHEFLKCMCRKTVMQLHKKEEATVVLAARIVHLSMKTKTKKGKNKHNLPAANISIVTANKSAPAPNAIRYPFDLSLTFDMI